MVDCLSGKTLKQATLSFGKGMPSLDLEGFSNKGLKRNNILSDDSPFKIDDPKEGELYQIDLENVRY